MKAALYADLSLYQVNEEAFRAAAPNLVITQTLCDVCAPSIRDVEQVLSQIAATATAITAAKVCPISRSPAVVVAEDKACHVISLEPESLIGVADTFLTVAEACGVSDRGIAMKRNFIDSVLQIQSIVNKLSLSSRPSVFLLEWIDPPFDGGHWVRCQITYGGCRGAMSQHDDGTSSVKSKQLTWEDLYEADPDCILVACCGFGLARNIEDAKKARERLSKLRAFRERRIYACDGNRYFARPGPSLAGGVAIVARCAYDAISVGITSAIDELDITPAKGIGWAPIQFGDIDDSSNASVRDIEEICEGFYEVHKAACDVGDAQYNDPATGFKVFTEVALKARGKCCGSGCRHCPYNHENVKDKASKIQQPAFLHIGKSEMFNVVQPLTSSNGEKMRVRVLFWSSGKDSFLTLRALVKLHVKSKPFRLILLTTFDSVSRVVAHQEVHINEVLKQAKHLDVSLVGVPVHRGSSESYQTRIRNALKHIENTIGQTVTTLVFGDLHLEHIKSWRDDQLGKLGADLEYPLWKVPYDILMNDLLASGITCVVAASTTDKVNVGTLFSPEFSNEVASQGLDAFGENGEFHTLSQVWTACREKALGII